jgi:glycosyltransferase involved in cell wall biosynthesis
VKVLALCGDGYGGFGGISRFNRDLLGCVCGLNEVHSVVGLARQGNRPFGTLPPKLIWRVLPGKAAFAAESIRSAAVHRPALVICGLVNLAPVAAAAARIAGARLWTIGHGIDLWERPTSLRARSLERSHLVTTVSRYTRARLLSWSTLPPERVRVLSNTFDRDRFTPGPPSHDLARRYGVEGRRVLMSLGRLEAREAYKGQDRVIRVLPSLLRSEPGLRYLIAGDGSDRPRLEQLAREQGVAEQVVFAGRIADDEIVEHYRLADVFVLPSTGEGFGIVFLEAASCGTPVVAGSVDGSVDALREGQIGTLVDPNDPADLERGILLALKRGRDVPAGLEALNLACFRSSVASLFRRVVSNDSE